MNTRIHQNKNQKSVKTMLNALQQEFIAGGVDDLFFNRLKVFTASVLKKNQ